ncbi:MAG: glycosyltransferase family 4 protein [Candidatus Kerfeldbacteria bacterium]|nr:glycosyltransferase family 4 protein [Candidatus Kerfeldbacteria bacterium]
MVIGIDASRANEREKTGTEWYSWHLLRVLVPLLGEHRVRLYTREPLEPILRQLGPPVEERVLRWPPGVLWSHLRLSWELLWSPPDVLLITADTVPLIHPRRTYTTIHDVAFERFPALYAQHSVQRRLGWLRPVIHLAVRIVTLGRYSASELDYHRWSVRHALRASRKILTVSEFTKSELVSLLGAGPEQVVVTSQGVSQPASFVTVDEHQIQTILARLGLSRPYFLFLGRLEAKKNIELLVHGYVEYRRQAARPVNLVLVGNPGQGWAGVGAWLHQAKRRQGIYQLGWQSPNDLRVLQKGASGFVFLSQYEGFGRPPLESLSARVPVLASRTAALPEVLGSCALYVDQLDPSHVARGLARLAEDEPLRASLVRCGLQRVQQFTWEETARRTVAVLLSA